MAFISANSHRVDKHCSNPERLVLTFCAELDEKIDATLVAVRRKKSNSQQLFI